MNKTMYITDFINVNEFFETQSLMDFMDMTPPPDGHVWKNRNGVVVMSYETYKRMAGGIEGEE